MSKPKNKQVYNYIIEKQYRDFTKELDCSSMTREQANEVYAMESVTKNIHAQKKLCKTDLFYLLTVVLKRSDANKDFVYDRCREVQKNPNGYLDLWSREHYKSTVITFAKTIQDLIIDPNVTIGIFSHTRPIAKAFLEQIKRELEQNEVLKSLFPEIFYQNPQNESSKWSLDSGITVKRSANPKEQSVEAWGIVDGQPTSKHFSILVYDDVVTRESVSTPEQIKKVTDSWGLSLNLGSVDGVKRYIGTRYHMNDTYKTMMDRGSVIPRIYPATKDGTMEGEPVLLTKESLMSKRRDMGAYIFTCQMMQNPVADKAMSFKKEWLVYYDQLGDTKNWNKYIVVDPASSKKATSDYTVMEVIGLAPDNNYYLIDAVRDRMNLTQRANKLFELHKLHLPKAVGYEKYGIQADIEHIKYVQEQKNYRFSITELGGIISKEDRIKKLVPIYEQKRFYMPKQLHFVDSEGVTRDYIREFIEDEYLSFPVSVHDDMMDCRARILDPVLCADFPRLVNVKRTSRQSYVGDGSWMG